MKHISSNRIKELRQEKKKTLDQMSTEIGLNRGTINNYENQKTEPSLENWQKLAAYFDVDVGYLQKLTPIKNQAEAEKKDRTAAKLLKNTKDGDELTIEAFEAMIDRQEVGYSETLKELFTIAQATLNPTGQKKFLAFLQTEGQKEKDDLLNQIKNLENLYILLSDPDVNLAKADEEQIYKVTIELQELHKRLTEKYLK